MAAQGTEMSIPVSKSTFAFPHVGSTIVVKSALRTYNTKNVIFLDLSHCGFCNILQLLRMLHVTSGKSDYDFYTDDALKPSGVYAAVFCTCISVKTMSFEMRYAC